MLNGIVIVKGKLNVIGYQEMLHGKLLSFMNRIGDKKTIFQQDNAPIYAINVTKSGFKISE